MRVIEVEETDAGRRLDRFLRERLRTMPLGAIFRHLRNGDIRVDGAKAAPSLRLAAGMQVLLRIPDADLRALAAAKPRRDGARRRGERDDRRFGEPRVVWEDADVLVVSKPAGYASQPGSGVGAANLVDWLDAHGIGARTPTFAPAPAHRLDRATSGLVAIGITPRGLRGLTAAFREDRVTKVYLAVVHGVPQQERGEIDAPLWQPDHTRPGRPKVVVDPRGKPARTEWQVLERGRARALLRVTLHTGRTHQIRAHLAHVGHPIVGDARYGSAVEARQRMMLHAAELVFPHPCTGAEVRCEEAAPPEFARTARE